MIRVQSPETEDRRDPVVVPETSAAAELTVTSPDKAAERDKQSCRSLCFPCFLRRAADVKETPVQGAAGRGRESTFSHSFNKYLLKARGMPGAVLRTVGAAGKRRHPLRRVLRF